MNNTESSVTISGKLTFEDVKAFSRINFYLGIKITRILTVLIVIIGILVGFIFIFDIILGRPVREDLNIAVTFAIALLLLFLIRLIIWLTPWLITRGYRILYDDFKVTISEKALSHQTESSSAKLTWEKIYKVIYGKDHILFYLSATMAYILPMRFIKEKEYLIIQKIIRAGMPLKKIMKRII